VRLATTMEELVLHGPSQKPNSAKVWTDRQGRKTDGRVLKGSGDHERRMRKADGVNICGRSIVQIAAYPEEISAGRQVKPWPKFAKGIFVAAKGRFQSATRCRTRRLRTPEPFRHRGKLTDGAFPTYRRHAFRALLARVRGCDTACCLVLMFVLTIFMVLQALQTPQRINGQ